MPMVRPRRLARSTSVKSPSGLRQSVSLSASLANSSGRCSPASRANCASALAQVSMSTKSGSRWKKLRITATWPAPRSPLRCASAVAGNTGGNGSPLNALRSPKSAASCTRRDASAPADPQPVGQRRGQLAAQLGRIGLLGELIDQGVFDGGLPAAHLFPPLNTRQPLGVVSTSKVRSRARL